MPFIAHLSTETMDVLSGRNIEVYNSIDSTDNKEMLVSKTIQKELK